VWGPRGQQLLAASPISNTGKRAVYYDWGRHNFLRALAEFVNVRRGTHKSFKLAFLALSKLDFFFCFCAASKKLFAKIIDSCVIEFA
jgi:hypothetical protein